MALKKLAISASGDMLTRIARFTGKECVKLDGSPLGPDTVVLVIRSTAGNALEEAISVVRDATSYGVPVIIVAGSNDGIGKALQNYAKKFGIPGECILIVRENIVVDGFGEKVGNALRGGGIGMHTVIAVSERAIEDNLVPEMSIWDDSGKQEPAEEEELSLWSSEENGRNQQAEMSATEAREVPEAAAQVQTQTAGPEQSPYPSQSVVPYMDLLKRLKKL